MGKDKETVEQKSLRFKQLCIGILAQSGNCQASQHDFGETTSIREMCDTWHKYWHGMITEVPQQVVQAFHDFYPDFKTEINAAGIFYNEDSRTAMYWLGIAMNLFIFSLPIPLIFLARLMWCCMVAPLPWP